MLHSCRIEICVIEQGLIAVGSKVRKKLDQNHPKIHSNHGVDMIFELPNAPTICDSWKIKSPSKNPDYNGDLDPFWCWESEGNRDLDIKKRVTPVVCLWKVI